MSPDIITLHTSIDKVFKNHIVILCKRSRSVHPPAPLKNKEKSLKDKRLQQPIFKEKNNNFATCIYIISGKLFKSRLPLHPAAIIAKIENEKN